MKTATISKPIIKPAHLRTIGFPEAHGISVHNGVIIVWDEDHDTRVITMIEERFPVGSIKPLAVCEHEGGVCILWKDRGDAECAAADDYTTEQDYWCPTHYHVSDDGEEAFEFPQHDDR